MIGLSILQRARRAFYGWRIVGAGGIIGAVGAGLAFYGFSVFFLPISESLKLSRAAISLVFSLSRSEGAIEGPIAGYLIDRLGPRKVLFVAAAMMGVGYILLSKVDSFVAFLLVYMVVISFGFNAGIMHVPFAAVNSWFVRRRGLALGVFMACLGLGGAFIPPALSLGIQHFGWRTTALLSGLAVLGIILPLSLVFRRSPESMGLLPDGDKEDNNGQVPQAPVLVDFEVSEALRTTSFWLLTLAISLRLAAHMGLIIHFVPVMVWKGTDETEAALLLGAIALFAIPFRILLGWAGDRFLKSRIVATGIGVAAVALLFLNYAQPGWQLWMFALLLASGESVGPLSWAIVGDFFGRRRFATIRGAMTALTSIASAVMPVVAGFIYDTSQSYAVTLWILSGLMVLSAVVFAIMRRPDQPTR